MVVDKSDARVRRMFGEIAPGYDRMNHLLSMNVDRYWRRRTVNKLAPKPNEAILDVCTGTADLAFAFAKRLDKLNATGDPATVVGSDFCQEMLLIGEDKRLKREVENLRLIQADTQCLPFADNQFDIVTVAFGLRNVANTDQGLREMTRVAKPGGRIAILEFTEPRRQPIKAFYGFYFSRILPRIGQFFANNQSEAYAYLPESVGEFPTYEALTERMQLAGMEDVAFHPLTFGIATLYIGVKAAAKHGAAADSRNRQGQLEVGNVS